jgi:hypothetical protein
MISRFGIYGLGTRNRMPKRKKKAYLLGERHIREGNCPAHLESFIKAGDWV